jgi:hypothetical protein
LIRDYRPKPRNEIDEFLETFFPEEYYECLPVDPGFRFRKFSVLEATRLSDLDIIQIEGTRS